MNHLKTSGLFLLKCVAFSVVFLGVWNYGFRTGGYQSNEKAAATAKAQNDAYESQVRQVMEQLAKTAEQQRRMEKIISTQEGHSERYEAVLQQWEKQTKLRP